jgi:hypothetical protein
MMLVMQNISFPMEGYNRFGEENHRLCQKLLRDLFEV